MEVILNERGKELILYKSYKLSCKELTKNGRKWRCTAETFNAKFYVDEGKTTILKEITIRINNHLLKTFNDKLYQIKSKEKLWMI